MPCRPPHRRRRRPAPVLILLGCTNETIFVLAYTDSTSDDSTNFLLLRDALADAPVSSLRFPESSLRVALRADLSGDAGLGFFSFSTMVTAASAASSPQLASASWSSSTVTTHRADSCHAARQAGRQALDQVRSCTFEAKFGRLERSFPLIGASATFKRLIDNRREQSKLGGWKRHSMGRAGRAYQAGGSDPGVSLSPLTAGSSCGLALRTPDHQRDKS